MDTAPLLARPTRRRGAAAGVVALAAATSALLLLGAARRSTATGGPVELRSAPSRASSSLGSSTALSPTAPHIVLVTLDDVGWNDLGYQSSDLWDATPHIDRLAAKGVRLSQYYGQPSCTPARATLMTGQFAHKLGFQDLEVDEYSNFSLPLERTPALLPARLRALGYKTYGLGKWNLGHCNARYLPWARGFDSFLGYFSGGASYTTHQAATFARGDAEYALYDLVEGKSPSKSAGAAAAADTLRVGARHAGTYDTQLYGAKAVALVREHAAAGGGDDDGAGQKNVSARLFLWLALHAAHADHGAPNATLLSAANRASLARLQADGAVSDARAQMATGLMVADAAVGDLAAELERTGLMNNTVLVVHSDNGAQPCTDTLPGSNYPLRSTKFQYFEGGVRVPALVYAPGRLGAAARGAAYDGLMHHVDWLVTFLGLALDGGSAAAAEVARADALDGVDQWAALGGGGGGADDDDDAGRVGAARPRDEIVFTINLVQADAATGAQRALVPFEAGVVAYRRGDFKLLRNTTDDGWYRPTKEYASTCRGRHCKLSFEREWGARRGADDDAAGAFANCSGGRWLFDVRRDPTERHNLYWDPSLASVRDELERRVRFLYETEWVQHTGWASEPTNEAQEAFLANEQYIVPWGCAVIE